MALGSRVERIYSLEWLLLASDNVNDLRLSGMEYLIRPTEKVQFAIRFKKELWTVDEVSDKLGAINDLWELCARTLEPNETAAPTLQVEKLSAGSPLDLFAWASQNWGGLIGTGGVASVLVFLLKHPAKVTEAIPRALAGWHEQWARAHRAEIAHLEAKADRDKFNDSAAKILKSIGAAPSDSAISGDRTMRLEIIPLPQSPATKTISNHNSELGSEVL